MKKKLCFFASLLLARERSLELRRRNDEETNRSVGCSFLPGTSGINESSDQVAVEEAEK